MRKLGRGRRVVRRPRSLLEQVTQPSCRLGGAPFEGPDVAFEEGDEVHRRRRRDGRRPPPRGEDGNLADHVAGTDGTDVYPVDDHLGGPALDREDRVPEVAFAHDAAAASDVDLVREPGDRRELLGRQLGEDRDRGETVGVHRATLLRAGVTVR